MKGNDHHDENEQSITGHFMGRKTLNEHIAKGEILG